MAGPTAAILVPTTLTDDDIRASIEGAYRVVHMPDSTAGQYRTIMDCWIEDRPFLVMHGEEYEGRWRDLHRAGFTALVGCAIHDEIGLAAMCGADVDHVLLGRLCLFLAERFQAVIDFGGCPPAPREPAPSVHWSKVRWPSIAAEEGRTRAMVAALPGRLIELPRIDSDPLREGHSFVCDAEFMRAWLGHKHFRMVK